MLKDARGSVSGESIARELNISRAAVWKQICRLRKEGFHIDAQTKLGYCLVSQPDKLTPMEIRDGLKTFIMGKEVSYHPKTESTNVIAKNLAMEGAMEGTLVIAEEQTKGRGRLNRNWRSSPGKDILMSLIFRPDIQAQRVFPLTMLTSLAIVKAIAGVTGLTPQIKWPNDIYVDNRKLGGILTEFSAEQDRVNYVVVGVGLNVNSSPSNHPEIGDIAVSLKDVLGKEIPRIELLRPILEEIEKGYNCLRQGKVSYIRSEWNTYSLVTGKPVRIISFDTVEEGIAEYVDGDGCLVIRDGEGRRKRILSGDVSLRIDT